MRLAWATDLHLNHASDAALEQFVRDVAHETPDRLLVTGDIAEAQSLDFFLSQLAASIRIPIDFVLGNHDFYHGDINRVRSNCHSQCAHSEHLHFMHKQGPTLLDHVSLIGVDGWGDGLDGDIDNSTITLNDFTLIEDLARLEPRDQRLLLAKLGQESAKLLRQKLSQSVTLARDIILITHVPPFRESCWYEGRTSDENWAPYFVCKSVGDCLFEFARNNQDHRFWVLCGHTHSAGEARILDNLHVSTGGAIYGEPRVERIIETTNFDWHWDQLKFGVS